jgi:DNA-binding NtrC family response regulator
MIGPPEAPAQPIRPLALFKDITVLIAEDEKLVAWDMEQTLSEAGLERIELVGSLLAAYRVISETVPGLVLLDLKLGDGSSEPLLQELQARAIPVLVITGYSDFADQNLAVLYKPFDPDQLTAAVAAVLAQRPVRN